MDAEQKMAQYQNDPDLPVRQIITEMDHGLGDTFHTIPASSIPTLPEGAIDGAEMPKIGGAASSLNYTETVSAGRQEEDRSRAAPTEIAEIS